MLDLTFHLQVAASSLEEEVAMLRAEATLHAACVWKFGTAWE